MEDLIAVALVEKQWLTKENYIATVKIDFRGDRVAYITLPKNHMLNNKSIYTESVLDNIKVRGTLTYSGKASFLGQNENLWSFGFDYAHYNDAPDIQKAKKLFTNVNVDKIYYEQGLEEQNDKYRVVTPLKQVKKDLKGLSKQLWIKHKELV